MPASILLPCAEAFFAATVWGVTFIATNVIRDDMLALIDICPWSRLTYPDPFFTLTGCIIPSNSK